MIFHASITESTFLIILVLVVLWTIMLFYNPKSEKTLSISEQAEEYQSVLEELNEQDNEIEEIIKYITDRNITSVKTNVYQIDMIDTMKKMYQDGLKKGQNPVDNVDEIDNFLMYHGYLDVDEDNLMMKLRQYPFTSETYFDDEETDVEKIRRPSIPQNIKDKVWNRDDGKCVQCGSNEKIEFDHIIPFSKGGSNTYRNLQILCEKCNRIKSDKIG